MSSSTSIKTFFTRTKIVTFIYKINFLKTTPFIKRKVQKSRYKVNHQEFKYENRIASYLLQDRIA